MMNPKGTKSQQKHARILDAANTVLRTKSYAETRLADIAKEAGTHAGAMYYHFDSKEALVEELLNRNASRMWAATEQKLAELPASATFRERIIATAKASLANLLGEKDEIIVYMRLINQVPVEIRNRLISHAKVSRHFIRDLIRHGQEVGEFRADINPSIFALMLLSNLTWAYDWSHPLKKSTDELAEDMCSILLSGIESREPAKHANKAARPAKAPEPSARLAAKSARPSQKRTTARAARRRA